MTDMAKAQEGRAFGLVMGDRKKGPVMKITAMPRGEVGTYAAATVISASVVSASASTSMPSSGVVPI